MISKFSEGNTLRSELPLTFNITYNDDNESVGLAITLRYGELIKSIPHVHLDKRMPIEEVKKVASDLVLGILKESGLVANIAAQIHKAITPREDVMPSSVNSFNPNTGDWSPCYSCPFYSRVEVKLPLTNTFNGPTRVAWAYTCAKSCWDKSIHKHVDQAKSFSGRDCSVYRDLIKNTKLGVSS